MRDYLKNDLFRYEGEKSHVLGIQLRYILFTAGFRYTWCFRHAQNARSFFGRLWWRFLTRRVMLRTGIQIPVSTKIGPGLKIGHFGAIVINPSAVIGKNFNIAQGCLIGNSQGRQKGTPIIGDNVVMGANSMVIGGVTIGNDVLIAPGAFVNFDVPDKSIVIGNPGQVIRRDTSPTSKYIVYPLN